MTPDLATYDIIVLNHSAGKDSQCQAETVCRIADKAGIMDRIVMVHADLGRAEWPGVGELAREHAAHYGIRFEVVKRPQGDILEHVLQRRRWPSSKQRFCTSDHKRGQVATLFTQLTREAARSKNRARSPRILSCMGMRSQESAARAKLPTFQIDRRNTNTKRGVDIWLPIRELTAEQAWERNREAGTRHHWAYDVGMKRLSCAFCIMANRESLLIAGKYNTELLREYARVEREIGHTFRDKFRIGDILEQVERGEIPEDAPDFTM